MRGALSGVLAGVLAGATLAATVPIAHAQPAPRPAPAPSAPDLERAKQLYRAAEQAVAESRFAEAVRDYSAVYEITRDPVLFYKMGSSNERAGRCDVALTYYERYLREARPSEEHVALTRARIAACGASPSPSPSPTTASGSASGPDPDPDPDPDPGTESGTDPGTESGTDLRSDTGVDPTSLTEPAPGDAGAQLSARNQGPWLLVAGSLAFVTIGAVLGYSANAAESDIDDLYVGLQGTPPAFDARTQRRYDDLVKEGERAELLSWVSFGVAGALGAGAAIWFLANRDEGAAAEERAVRIVPTARRDGGGVAARFRF
ncbi:MAG: hypothetical protein M3680_10415 [Myxococcota bacterium]|nr:hypothetical protein [Myxococcota bacterium]